MPTPSTLLALAPSLAPSLLAVPQDQGPGALAAIVADRSERIDALFARWDRSDSPGAVCGVIVEGELVHAKGFGTADLERRSAIGPTTVFRVASTSKQFTAVCVLLLADDGALSLDDDVRAYVPELPEYEPPIRARHLIHQVSGLRDYPFLMQLAGARVGVDPYDDDDVMRMVARQSGVTHLPGESFYYSNTNYWLLARIAERASATPLAELARERVFRPLGMDRTRFVDDLASSPPGHARGYVSDGEGGFELFEPSEATLGAGGVATCIEDLVAWDRNFYEPVVGDRETIEAMHAAWLFSDGARGTYGAGLNFGEYRGHRVVEHAGGYTGYRAQLLRFPELSLTVVVLANLRSIDADDLCRAVADLLIEDRGSTAPRNARALDDVGRPAISLPLEALECWAGRFRMLEANVDLEVELVDDRLVGSIGRDRFDLVPIGPGEFRVAGTANQMLRFGRGPRGDRFADLRVGVSARSQVFTAVEDIPSLAALADEVVGRYVSPDLDAAYELAFEEEAFVVRLATSPSRRMSERPLLLVAADVLLDRDEDLSYTFQRGVDLRVSGFVLALRGDPHSLEFSRVSSRDSGDALEREAWPPELAKAADGVAALFDHHPFVFLGSTHADVKIHEFLLCLLSRPSFQERATDIVVEFANPVHQVLVDRFLIELEALELDALAPVWFDTAVPELWARIPQVPEFFEAVRAVNERLEKDERIRVLGGNSPVDWSRVETVEDLAPYPFKTNWTAHLITDHLAPDPSRRVLVVFGEGHNHHSGGTLMADLEARMERTELGVVGAIRELDAAQEELVARFGDPTAPFFCPASRFPETGAAPADFFYARDGPLARYVDAVVYLGPEPDRSTAGSLPFSAEEKAELARRNAIRRDPRSLEIRFGGRERWFEGHPREIPEVR